MAAPHLKRTHLRRNQSTTIESSARDSSPFGFRMACRAPDYLIANEQLLIRRIGTRTLIPASQRRRFSCPDHPKRIVR
jgi:hypothetical protein